MSRPNPTVIEGPRFCYICGAPLEDWPAPDLCEEHMKLKKDIGARGDRPGKVKEW